VLVADPTLRIVLITVSFASTLAFTAPFWTIPPTFLSGAASAGGFAAISSIGVIGGFVAPTIIGYLTGLTGDSRVGLAFVAVLAMVMAGVFYFVGRHLVAKDRMHAPALEQVR
jgi:nitrate/nitrite transporter NarK